MKESHRRISLYPLLALIAATGVIVGGCADSPLGVFESIELEREIVDDRELSNEIGVGSIARAGSGTDAKYFIATGSIWYRDVVDPDYDEGQVAQWSNIGAPGTTISTSAVAFGDPGSELIYAAYTATDALDGGVYTIDPSNIPEQNPTVTGDPVFAFDRDTASGDYTPDRFGIGRLLVVNDGSNDYLVVPVKTSTASDWTIYVTADGSTFAEVSGLATLQPVMDVAPTGSTGAAYLTEKGLFVDSNGLTTDPPPANVTGSIPRGSRNPGFGGIYYQVSTDTLWLTDDEGYIYRAANFSTDFGATSANWSVNASAYLERAEAPALVFNDIVAVDPGGTELLIAGTVENGYREVVFNSSSGTWEAGIPDATSSNYQASDLAQATIDSFLVIPDQVDPVTGETHDLLFAGTSNLGLWKVFYSSAPQWVQE